MRSRRVLGVAGVAVAFFALECSAFATTGALSGRNLFFHIGRWGNGKADQSKYDKTPGKAGFSVRNTRYRLVNNEGLYDIINDSGEAKNLYAQKTDII